MPTQRSILTLNGGSSSIRFALFSLEDSAPNRWASGKLDGIGTARQSLHYRASPSAPARLVDLPADANLLDWIGAEFNFDSIAAAGHRVVHGMRRAAPEIVTDDLLTDLRKYSGFDPEHLPGEIALMDALRRRMPDLLQVACFDTAFHRGMPLVARTLSIPHSYFNQGVERYGFHGLSYTYLLRELERVAGTPAANGRVIFAHLGNGASMAAVRDGKSIDTTMGFTPAGGLPMGTRAGDIDSGLAAYLVRPGGLSPDAFARMVHHESGLLGVSAISADMRDLLESQTRDPRAAVAVDLFCYQARKWIGALAAALGGVDTLVFAGGIGENAPEVRRRVCEGLEFLGLLVDPPTNAANAPVISPPGARATIRVIATDEESIIVDAVFTTLKLRQKDQPNG